MTTYCIPGQSQVFGPIEVIPIVGPRRIRQEWGWGLGGLHVTEAPDPRPNALHVSNSGGIPVFLPVGFLVEGLQQSRMVAEDIIVPPASSREVPVLCVEAGRFHAPVAAQAAGRAPLSTLLAGLLTANDDGPPGAPRTDRQTAVWESVSRHERRSGGRPTHSLAQVMTEDRAQRTTQQTVEAGLHEGLNLRPNQVGVVASVAGQPLVVERFGSPAMAKAHIADLIRGLAFDADGVALTRTPPREITKFVAQLGTPKIRATVRLSGALALNGFDSNVLIHGISAGPQEQLHLMALNRRHPLLQGAAL